jgi:Legume lectin domain
MVFSAGMLLVWTSTARATTESFPNFEDVSSLTLSGNAQQIQTADGWVLRLTQAVYGQSGSAFGTVRISAAQFYTSFAFRLSDPNGTDPDPNGSLGADGITFAVQGMSASLGTSGGGLGIQYVSPSVAVEFDTYENVEYDDPSSNHIGIDINGVVTSVATADIATPFNDGNVWYAWIDCDASTITVSVSEDAVRPAVPQLSYAINVEQTIGDAFAYVGFTAGTGGGFQNQDILSWVYLDHSLAADAGAPSLDGGDLPDGSASSLDASLDGARGDRPTSNDASMASSSHSGGCGCDAGGGGASLGILWLLGALLLALGTRRPVRAAARRPGPSPSGR